MSGEPLEKRGAAVAEGASPTYSTTTYSDGEVSTFVYTTRPIVSCGRSLFASSGDDDGRPREHAG
jgi:hypothetical protein